MLTRAGIYNDARALDAAVSFTIHICIYMMAGNAEQRDPG